MDADPAGKAGTGMRWAVSTRRTSRVRQRSGLGDEDVPYGCRHFIGVGRVPRLPLLAHHRALRTGQAWTRSGIPPQMGDVVEVGSCAGSSAATASSPRGCSHVRRGRLSCARTGSTPARIPASAELGLELRRPRRSARRNGSISRKRPSSASAARMARQYSALSVAT